MIVVDVDTRGLTRHMSEAEWSAYWDAERERISLRSTWWIRLLRWLMR